MRFFRKKKKEEKNYSPIYYRNLEGCTNNLFSYDRLNYREIIYYYKTVQPLKTGIDYICEQLQQIKPFLFNKNSNKFEDKSELIDKLLSPNWEDDWEGFIFKIGSFYKLFGNVYIIITNDNANVNKPPLEIFVYDESVVSYGNNNNNIIETYYLNISGGIQETYSLNNEYLEPRYFNDSQTRELIHIKSFNFSGCVKGLSSIESMQYDLNQYIQCQVHNTSLLENGAKLGGFIKLSNFVNQEQFDKIVEGFKRQFTGSNKAGKYMILNNQEDVQPAGQSNKDMDFLELKKMTHLRIYEALNIPLSLVNPESMTFNNTENGRVSFYEETILPFISKIMALLSKILIKRYNIDQNVYEITYNREQIDALEESFNLNALSKKNVGVHTINEIRELYGLDPIENEKNDMPILSMNSFNNNNLNASLKEANSFAEKNGVSQDQILKILNGTY